MGWNVIFIDAINTSVAKGTHDLMEWKVISTVKAQIAKNVLCSMPCVGNGRQINQALANCVL